MNLTDPQPVHFGAPPTGPHRFIEGPSAIRGELRFRIQYFTYDSPAGRIVGRNTHQQFTLPRGAAAAWPLFKDFNLWQNGYGYRYSGLIGDLEGRDFVIESDADAAGSDPNQALRATLYRVLKVVPEHLIVIAQSAPGDGPEGGVSPGFHTFVLGDREDTTEVQIYTEHSLVADCDDLEESFEPLRVGGHETVVKWADNFIPELIRIVGESGH